MPSGIVNVRDALEVLGKQCWRMLGVCESSVTTEREGAERLAQPAPFEQVVQRAH